jgi:hypothetical protein
MPDLPTVSATFLKFLDASTRFTAILKDNDKSFK